MTSIAPSSIAPSSIAPSNSGVTATSAATVGNGRRRSGFGRAGAVVAAVVLLALGACRSGGAALDGGADAGVKMNERSALSGTVAVGAADTEATVAPRTGAVPATPSSAPVPEQTPPSLPVTAKVGLPPQGKEPRNDLGDPVRLDETASLACAHAEFASEAFDDADQVTAREEITAIARWGMPSANADISRASSALGGTGGTVPASRGGVDAFLALCQSNGHR